MTLEADNPSQENTYILSTESMADINRLTIQHTLLTKEMDGLLPDTIDPSQIHDVLDIACGPGGWVLDLAYTHKHMQVIGVDISERTIDYANSRKYGNTSFQKMDVRQRLNFPDNAFDFVNGRLLCSFMPKTSWPAFIKECMRITRPGGYICLTECENGITNSPACEQLSELMMRVLYITGQSFSPIGKTIGITPMLGGFLQDEGCEPVKHKAFAIDFSAKGAGHAYMYENSQIGFLLAQPLILKLKLIDQTDLIELCHQTLKEMQAPNFRGVWYYLSVWGKKSA